MNTFYFLCLLLFQVISAYATGPIDEEIIQGKLANGLSYYVRENCCPQEKASLYLVVKVGSIYENEEEKGIAHFIEHLVFRGSENFADGEVMDYLESIGSWSGTDANAYTSYESTVYQIEIPLNKEGSLETALSILKDFACNVTLSMDGIEKERNVVLDELNHDRCSAQSRSVSKIVRSFFPHSIYADHAPIGLENIIRKVSPEVLRKFYKKWYRPDRMAVIVVGDFDASAIEKKIEGYFGDIRLPEEILEEPNKNLEYDKGAQAVVHYDPDLDLTNIGLLSFFPIEPEQTFSMEDIKPALISVTTNLLLETRLEKIAHKDAVFLDTGVEESEFLGGTGYFFIGAGLFEERVEEGLQQLNREIQKVVKFGFSKKEWQNLKSELKTGWKRTLSHSDKMDHEDYVSNCIDHFLNSSPLISENWFLRHMLECIETFTIEDINASLLDSHLSDHFKIFLSTPSQKVAENISEERLLQFFSNEEIVTEPEIEKAPAPFDLEPRFPSGEIAAIYEDEHAEVTYLTLSNGITLVLKKTDLDKNEMTITAQAAGGLASLPAEAISSAMLSTQYCQLSGINGLSYDELLDLERSKGIHFHSRMNAGTRSLYLSSNTEHMQYLFKLIHEFFLNPQFDKQAWQHLIDKQKELRKQDSIDHDSLFETFVSKINSQDYFYFQPFDLDVVEEMTAQKMRKTCFANPRDFTFIAVGDFDTNEVVRLAEKYLASIPVSAADPFPALTVPNLFPSEKVHAEFKSGNKTYVTNMITFPYDFYAFFEKYQNTFLFDGIRKILHNRLEDVLRQEQGNTYGVSVDRKEIFYPDFSHSLIQIGFTCQAEHREKMIEFTLAEIKRLKDFPPTQEEVAKLQALFLENKKKEIQLNRFWTNAIFWSQFQHVPLNKVLSYTDNINSMTAEKLHEAAKVIFSSPLYTALSHLPEDADKRE